MIQLAAPAAAMGTFAGVGAASARVASVAATHWREAMALKTTVMETAHGWAWEIAEKMRGNSGRVFASGNYLATQAAAKAVAKATREALEKRAGDLMESEFD